MNRKLWFNFWVFDTILRLRSQTQFFQLKVHGRFLFKFKCFIQIWFKHLYCRTIFRFIGIPNFNWVFPKAIKRFWFDVSKYNNNFYSFVFFIFVKNWIHLKCLLIIITTKQLVSFITLNCKIANVFVQDSIFNFHNKMF